MDEVLVSLRMDESFMCGVGFWTFIVCKERDVGWNF